MSNWRSHASSTPAQRQAIIERGRKAALSQYGPWDGKCARCHGDGPFPYHRRVCTPCINKDVKDWQDAHREQERRRAKRYRQRKSRDPEWMERERIRAVKNRQKAREQQ